MKQNIFMAALLAAMLAIAGCGGGSSSTGSGTGGGEGGGDNGGGDPVTKESISMKIKDCGDADCVDAAIQEAKDGGISGAELTALEDEADTRKMAIANADPSLSESELAAAFQLADGLAGSEALQLGSFEIDTQTAMPTSSADWKDQATANLRLGWEGKGWRDPNPEGSDGEEEDMRVWTENALYISEKYDVFFATTAGTHRAGANGAASVNGVIPLIELTDAAITEEVRNVLPSFFFRRGFTYNAAFDHDNDNDTPLQERWILEGRYHGVPGVFVCNVAPCNTQYTTAGTVVEQTDNEKPSATLFDSDGKLRASVSGITFIPSNFDKDETDVPALFAKKQNPNFLNFGVYWTTVINDGEVTAIRVDPFAGGGTEFEDTDLIVEAATGKLTAKYEGVAAGTFVTTKINDDNDEEPTGYGGFSADANFTAVFSGGKNTLSGTIENFRKRADQAGKGDPVATWKVELSGEIEAGKVEEDNFHAQFYGETTDKRQSNGHGYAPYGLVGTFEESIEHATEGGHVSGSFGAECQGSNCIKPTN